MKCASCSFDNPGQMTFCGKCGGRLMAALAEETTTSPTTRLCPKCGERMPSHAAFCGMCGTLLQEKKGAPPVEALAPVVAQPETPLPATTAPPNTPLTSSAEVAASPAKQQVETVGGKSSEPVEKAELRSPEGSFREMVLLPSGWFAMGSEESVGNRDEHPLHQVELSTFFIDRHAVSNKD